MMGIRSEQVNLDLSKKELASILGTIPETLSRTIKHFQKQRLIEISEQGKLIKLKDLLAVKEMAGQRS